MIIKTLLTISFFKFKIALFKNTELIKKVSLRILILYFSFKIYLKSIFGVLFRLQHFHFKNSKMLWDTS